MVNDALNIIETLPAKKVPASDIRYLVEMAMKIGQIATKYDEYIRAGGKHVPSLFINEGDTKNESESEPARRAPPIS